MGGIRAGGTGLLVIALLAGGVFSSCAGGSGSASDGARPAAAAPQPLTLEQAERLAGMRTANYEARSASFRTRVPSQGRILELEGVIDWTRHAGSAVYRDTGASGPDAGGLVQWDFSKVAAHSGGAVDGPPPAPPRDGAWQVRPIAPTEHVLDTLLLLLLNLASPQVDNPVLLQQGDARFLGTEQVDGREAWRFSGPSASGDGEGGRLVYTVRDDGRIARLEATLGATPVEVEFDAAVPAAVELLPDVGSDG